jgi:hypothetical protein
VIGICQGSQEFKSIIITTYLRVVTDFHMNFPLVDQTFLNLSDITHKKRKCTIFVIFLIYIIHVSVK